MTKRRYALRCLALAAVGAGLASLAAASSAAAQGGAVCSYGPADYRACCKQSYARKPSLSASARADDIDACMAGNGDSDSRERKRRQ